MKIFFVFCVISCVLSVVFNQDINETSIDIHSSVEHKSGGDSSKVLPNNAEDYRKYVSSAATALADVINEFFIKQDIPFDILLFGNIEKKTVDVVHEMGKKLTVNYATTVKWIDHKYLKNYKIGINQSAIILSDEDDIEKLNYRAELTNDFPKKLKFLIYTHKSGDRFEAPMFLISEGHISQFQYFLAESKNDDELELTTLEWFTDTECNFKTHKVLNIFNRTSLKWQKKLKNHQKFKNLYNCLIHVYTEVGQLYDINGITQAIEYDIINIVAQRRNFTVIRGLMADLIETKIQREEEQVFLNCNVVLDTQFLSEYKIFHFTTTFTEDKITFIITPGDLYTSYEKILMPFDELTWYFLIATFCIAFGVIFVVNLMPKQIQDYFYGEWVSVPAFNVVGTFFGIGQLRLPTANFPRFILMIFILFCLIIRTAYQGVMFEMMTKEMRKKSPQTVDDLFGWNFSVNIVMIGGDFALASKIVYENLDETIREKTKQFDFDKSFPHLCPIIFNPEKRFAVNADTIMFKEVTIFCKKTPLLLNEVFAIIQKGIAMDRNNFLFEAVEEVMQLTIPTGIPQYWGKYHHWYRYERNHYGEIVDLGAQILRLEDLSFGFIIWLISCGVAALGLLCELIVFAISKLKRLTRVVPTEINNTNILQPRKPIKIKVKKAKKLKKPDQHKSTLDVQILMEIHDEIINKAEVELNPSEAKLNNAKNLQQAEINQQKTVLQIKDDIDEESESANSTIISSKVERTKIEIENEKIRKSERSAVSGSGNIKDLKVTDLENDVNDDFKSRISSTELSSKEDLNKTESTKILKIEICNVVDTENYIEKELKI